MDFLWRGFQGPSGWKETFYFKESNYYTIRLKKDTSDKEASLITLYLDHLSHSRTDLKRPFHLEYPTFVHLKNY